MNKPTNHPQESPEGEGRKAHETQPVLVWADCDLGIADLVAYLNTIPGVRTHASCQGTIGEGGPHPYRAQVMCGWTPEAFALLSEEFDITYPEECDKTWGYVHPREGWVKPATYAEMTPVMRGLTPEQVERVKEIRAKWEAATKGPWSMYVDSCRTCADHGKEGEYGIRELAGGYHALLSADSRADADFIANSWSAVEFLLSLLPEDRK
jgi:hypothetical protein